MRIEHGAPAGQFEAHIVEEKSPEVRWREFGLGLCRLLAAAWIVSARQISGNGPHMAGNLASVARAKCGEFARSKWATNWRRRRCAAEYRLHFQRPERLSLSLALPCCKYAQISRDSCRPTGVVALDSAQLHEPSRPSHSSLYGGACASARLSQYIN